MRGAIVIAGKDLRNMFMSPLFWVVAGICSGAWWLMFAVRLRDFLERSNMQMYQMPGQGEGGIPLHYVVTVQHFSLVNFFMIFALSAVTMRLFTEEKRNRTFDLLLTAPVTATDIALGKLLAGVLTAWALIAIACVYPMSLSVFGRLEWGPLLTTVLGVLLLTASYVAVGMFASSITSSAVVSVILAVIFNVMFWFIGALAEAGEGLARKVFEHMSITEHIQDFMKGTISTSGIVFFASVVFLFTFLTQRVVESQRWR